MHELVAACTHIEKLLLMKDIVCAIKILNFGFVHDVDVVVINVSSGCGVCVINIWACSVIGTCGVHEIDF